MADGKVTRAELAEAVRELREEVARLRCEAAAHHCTCQHITWNTYPPALPAFPQPPFIVTCEVPALTFGAATSVAAGGAQIQTLMVN